MPQRIVDAACEKERTICFIPLVVKPGEQCWFLLFPRVHTWEGRVRIVSHADIVSVLQKIKCFDVETVFGSEHLLEAGGCDLLLESGIRVLAWVPDVVSFQRIAAVAKSPVLGGFFGPCAAAEVLCERAEAKVVALK